MLLDALEANKSVVVDDAKVSTKDEAHLRKLVGDRASVRVQNVRDGSVAPPVFVDGAPLAIIVDLDGTYALMGDRDPYDASRAEVDALNAVVHSIVQAYKRDPTRQLILCSGRQSEHRGATERWLAKHDIAYDELFMRETGDFRKDTVVKREIFERNIREKYNVEWVLDDRASVVDMWRNELGLVCLQVAEGAF
jgi:hypothetical protein